MRRGLAPTEPAGALFMLLLVFPGSFLPIDAIYAAGGVMAYATPDHAARIYLYAVALSFVASAACCLLCVALGALAGGGRRYDAAAATFAAHWLGVSLAAFALGHGLLLWSSYYVDYDPELRWARMLVLAAVSAAIGWRVTERRRPEHLSAISAGLRACALAVAAGALAALGILALDSEHNAERPASAAPARNSPSIFLITIDTLSALHMPMYGYRRATTPRLAEFAAEMTVFQRNYASSNFTTGSVASMLFGVRPWEHRVVHLEGKPPLRLFADSLPGLLAQSGYLTASVATNGWASPRHLRIERHFAVLSDYRVCVAANPVYALDTDVQTAIQNSLVWSELAWLIVRFADWLRLCERGHFDPELAFSEARRILGSAPPGRPMFLWIHLFPPHDPYVAPGPFVGTFNPGPGQRDRLSTIPPNLFEAADQIGFPGLLRDRYDESIRYLDHYVGAFLDELKRQGRYDPSVVVISADHGESFTKGYGQHGGPMLHEELVRVPLLIKLPGQRARVEVSAPTELVDLQPTLLELAGTPAPRRGEGVSLVPLIEGTPADRPVFSMNFQQSRRFAPLESGAVAMIHGRWKYVHYFGAIRYPRMPELSDGLYDLEADPWETRNLAALHPEVAARMRVEIEARLRRHAGASG
jgi:arylsulfatase A-like enzyme